MSKLDTVLQNISDEIFEKMDALLPDVESAGGGQRLVEAMRYSSLSTGKRLRPVFDCYYS